MENIVTIVFKVESQAYQAFSELKHDPTTDLFVISPLALVKKQNGHITPIESFDTGVHDETVAGGLIGGLIGIIGGPIGMLLGGSAGLMTGSAVAAKRTDRNIILAERVATRMKDGDVALIGLVQETDEVLLDSKFKKSETVIMRQDAATVQDEVREAARIQKEIEKQVKKDLSVKKSAERNAKILVEKENIKKAINDFIREHTTDSPGPNI